SCEPHLAPRAPRHSWTRLKSGQSSRRGAPDCLDARIAAKKGHKAFGRCGCLTDRDLDVEELGPARKPAELPTRESGRCLEERLGDRGVLARGRGEIPAVRELVDKGKAGARRR